LLVAKPIGGASAGPADPAVPGCFALLVAYDVPISF